MNKLIRNIRYLDLDKGIGRELDPTAYFTWDINNDIITEALKDIFLNDIPKTFIVSAIDDGNIVFKIEELVF